jgi:DNA phosphorothioation-associated putative methyltransferase
VFYVFRDQETAHTYLASRFTRRRRSPRIRISRSERRFEEHQELLEPLIGFYVDRGRLPEGDELNLARDIQVHFGTLKRAFSVVQEATGAEQWNEIASERAQDLLVYLALARFDGRPSLRDLPEPLRLDIRAFFSSYRNACTSADDLLFAAGKQDEVSHACAESPIGKCTQEALYVHVDSLSQVPPLLRVYEGCARAYVGSVDGANILKMHRAKPQVSYGSAPQGVNRSEC